MKHTATFNYGLLLALIVITFPFTLHAEDAINQASNVFKFQQKLAKKGNVNAQYRLGSMYEMGEGVETDNEQARHWYIRASEAGSEPAKQRITYLTIIEQGYDQAKNGEWLHSVINDASQRKPDAVLLLGQLYRQGLGVEQDLDKSLELLNQVRILGTANVDKEIASIRLLIDAKNNAPPVKRENIEPKNALLPQVINEKQRKQAGDLAKQSNQPGDTEKQAEATSDIKTDKRKKYEEVMRKLKMEQQLIDQLQAEVTDTEMTAIDDEI